MGFGHGRGLLPVPLQPVVIVAVEEVRLRSDGSDVRVNPEKLQQSPGPPLLHPDDDGLGQLLAPGAVGEAGHGHGARSRRPALLLRLGPHLVPVLGSVRLRLVVEQVSGSGEPDGGLLVVALYILPGLRLGQPVGRRLRPAALRPPGQRRAGLLASVGVHHQTGDGGAVAHAGVKHVNPDEKHDAEQQQPLLHGAGAERMQAVGKQPIFHKPSGVKSRPSGACCSTQSR